MLSVPADLVCVLACLCECTLRAQNFGDSADIRRPRRYYYAWNECAITFRKYCIKHLLEIIICACKKFAIQICAGTVLHSKEVCARNLPTPFCGRAGVVMHKIIAQKYLAQNASNICSKLSFAHVKTCFIQICAGTVLHSKEVCAGNLPTPFCSRAGIVMHKMIAQKYLAKNASNICSKLLFAHAKIHCISLCVQGKFRRRRP